MRCPICQKPTDKASRPFCSQRCADIDLGKWLTGSYAIPATRIEDTDEVEPGRPAPSEHKPH